MPYHLSTLAFRVLRAATAISVVGIGLVAATSTPAYANCSNGSFRAGDDSNGISNAYNIQSQMETPYSGEITGISSSRPSGADIYLINGSDFVQFGWYLGAASQLPYTTTPRMFIGEYYPGQTNNELLRAGPTLSWSTYYRFEIVRASNNNYTVYFQGVSQFTTKRTHFSSGGPGFNGEVDYNCTVMAARAYKNASPPRSLQYQNSSTGWKYFADSRYASSGFYSLSAGDQATDWAYGG